MDRGAWWAIVYRATKSQNRLKQLSTHTYWCQRGKVRAGTSLPVDLMSLSQALTHCLIFQEKASVKTVLPCSEISCTQHSPDPKCLFSPRLLWVSLSQAVFLGRMTLDNLGAELNSLWHFLSNVNAPGKSRNQTHDYCSSYGLSFL